ncbi:MAG: complex I subunit 5 family protein [Verrucomicrobiota bacterium]
MNMYLPDNLATILLLLAPTLPLLYCVLIAIPALRDSAIRFSPIAAFPALLLALFAQSGTALNPPWPIKLASLELTGTARVFLGFSAVLWLLADWFARGYLTEDRRRTRFYEFFLLSMAGNFVLLLAQDIPTFYSGFALMGFASCGLVVHKGDAAAVRAGRIYLILAAVGEVLLFVAFGIVSAAADSVQIAEVVNSDMPMSGILLLLIAFGIKAGALALHFWLPLAHPAAPVPASAVLSGAMIKAGLFGWLQFLPLGLVAMPNLGASLIATGILSALLGTVAGVTQRNAKTVLAYSSFSQMGIITVGLGVAFLQPEAWPGLLAAILIYALHHGLAKGALFLGVTPASEANNRREIWIARIGLLLPALALAGAPFTSGAMAKLALKAELNYLTEPWGYIVGFLLTLAAMGTTLKMIRFLVLSWPPRPAAADGIHHRVWIPWGLSVASVFVGIWILPGSAEKLSDIAAPKKLWTAFWPVLAGIGLAAIGSFFVRKLKFNEPKGIPAGDMIVPIEWIYLKLTSVLSKPSGPKVEKSENAVSPIWSKVLMRTEAMLSVFSIGALTLATIVVLLLVLITR